MELYKELVSFQEELIEYKSLLHPDITKPREVEKINLTAETKRRTLVRKSGSLAQEIRDLIGKDTITIFEFGKPREVNVWDMGLRSEYDRRTSEALNACIDHVTAAIGKLGARGKSWEVSQGALAKSSGVSAPKAFLSHGKAEDVLKRIESFLKAIGFTPLIVKEQPSTGKALDDKVNHYLEQADCAIIIATADDRSEDGTFQPRQNVIHEIGLAQAKYPDKIVYLLEENSVFPSNIRPKVWEPLSRNNLENVFRYIAMELTAMGLLTARRVEEV